MASDADNPKPLLPIAETAQDPDTLVQQRQVNFLRSGRVATIGSFTMTNGDTSTVVSHNLFQEHMVPTLVPLSAAGAGSAPYISSRGVGTFTITHTDPGADADFVYSFIG